MVLTLTSSLRAISLLVWPSRTFCMTSASRGVSDARRRSNSGQGAGSGADTEAEAAGDKEVRLKARERAASSAFSWKGFSKKVTAFDKDVVHLQAAHDRHANIQQEAGSLACRSIK